MFSIVSCPHCSQVQIARETQKTRSCSSCGRRINLSTSRVLGAAKTAREARILAAQTKEALKRKE